QSLATGDEAVLLVGVDNCGVVACHRCAVERAAALEHDEDLGVIVAVRRRFEAGRKANDLREEARVTLREELAAHAHVGRGLGDVGIGTGPDGHVPVDVVETIDVTRHASASLTRGTTSSPSRSICSRAASMVTPGTCTRRFNASARAVRAA